MLSRASRTLSPAPEPSVPAAAWSPPLRFAWVESSTSSSLMRFGDLDQAAGSGAVGELEVVPEVLEHLDEVAFSAAVEAAHPHARLLGLIEVGQVAAKDALEALGVLAIADEVRDLVAKRV